MDSQQLEELKQRLIKRAILNYGSIQPCGYCRELDECFTVQDDTLCLWFITDDKNTHMVMESTSNSLSSILVERTI